MDEIPINSFYNTDSRSPEYTAQVLEAQVFQDLTRRVRARAGGGIRLASRNPQTSVSVYKLLASELFSKSTAVVPVQPRHRVQAPKSFFGQSASGVWRTCPSTGARSPRSPSLYRARRSRPPSTRRRRASARSPSAA